MRTRLGIGAATLVCALAVWMPALPAGAVPKKSVRQIGRPISRQTLYEGAKGTLPGKQGWLFFATGGVETKPLGSGATAFSTLGSPAFQGGYSTVSPFPLDRKKGFTVGFDLQVLAESHDSPNRSGVDVIVLGHDQKGLELAFWMDQVWAQSDRPLFEHAEGAALDTTARGAGAAGLIHYELRMRGNVYRLTADGRSILTGAVRDYTAFTGTINPYQTPDFLFLGDDTHSAAGKFRLSRVWIKKSE